MVNGSRLPGGDAHSASRILFDRPVISKLFMALLNGSGLVLLIARAYYVASFLLVSSPTALLNHLSALAVFPAITRECARSRFYRPVSFGVSSPPRACRVADFSAVNCTTAAR